MASLSEVYRQIAECRDCGLHIQRNRVVPGEGAESATIFFIGEAPGWHEDQQGRPFVGPAGKFLDELLASIGLVRSEVYIANVVKCRPPANREPLPTEIKACQKWLDLQIELIKPRLLVTLGRFSMAKFFPGKTISKVHGTWYRQNGVTYFAMYHPAAALHQDNLRQTLIEDMKKIPPLLVDLNKITDTGTPEKKDVRQQLSMF